MNTNLATRHVACFLFLMSLCGLANFAYGDDPAVDASILKDVVARQRANWGAIKTWTGEVSVVDHHDGDGEVLVDTESRATFAYRAEPAALRWNWDVLAVKGKARNFNPSTTNGIIKGGKLFLLEIPSSGAAKGSREIRVVEPKSVKGPARQKFDPIYFSSYWGEDSASRLEFLRTNASEWKYARQGDFLTVTYEEPHLMNRYAIDLAKGASVVRYDATDSETPNTASAVFWAWTYEKKGDLWAPSALTIANEYLPKPGADATDRPLHRTTLRQITWTKSELNGAVDDGEFALEKIGIREGDGIDDDTPLGRAGPVPKSSTK